jgi:uncharacterized protein with GYD domain
MRGRCQTPKYLFQGSSTVEGLRGLLREGGTKRREAVGQLVQYLGERWKRFYAYGGDDFFIVVDMPDSVTTTTASLVVHATGAV